MKRLLVVGAVVFAGVCLAAARARAEVRPRVAVLELSLQGRAAPELRTQLERSLGAGLTAGGFDVVGRDAVAARLRTQPELAGCTSTTCLERLGTLLGVDRFVRGRVEVEGASYAVRAELSTAARSLRVVEKSCAVCTLAEANDLIREAGMELGPKNRSLVDVVVRSDPPGLPVSVDMSARGNAPVELSLPPGRHVFQLTVDGKPGPENIVEVEPPAEPGTAQNVTLTRPIPAAALRPQAEDVAPGGGEPRWRQWKWMAIGGGGALLLTGIVLFAIDGDEVDCAAGRPCRFLRETTAWAIVTTGVGLGAGALGVWMFLDDARAEARVRAAVVPRRGGGVFTLSGRF